jgi:hypothetical protein
MFAPVAVGSWPELRQMLGEDPMLRLYAACPSAQPPPGGTPVPYLLFPDHPAVPAGSGAVTARALASAPELARTVLTHPSLGSHGVLDTLVEYLLRPMLRVFRTSLDRYGSALVDPGNDVLFELTPDRAPTGRVVVTALPVTPLPGPEDGAVDGLAAVAALATAGGAALNAKPLRVMAALVPVIAAELRYLRPATERLLRADPRWAPYAHAVPAATEDAMRRVLDLVRVARSPAGGGRRDTPVVHLLRSPRDSEPAGLARFRQEIFYLGGELREVGGTDTQIESARWPVPAANAEMAESADPTAVVATMATTERALPGTRRPGDTFVLHTFERAPDTWREPMPLSPPALSHATSLASVRVGDLRRNPLAEQYAVRWGVVQTDALVSRLVATAKSSAARIAENAVASRGGSDRHLGAVERQARLIYHVCRRRQFKLGASTDYPVEQAVRSLTPAISRGEPVGLTLMVFATKFSYSQLKAPGPMPDLADLAMMVRLTELIGALDQVYPPGARVTLVTDGEHFRRHPRLPLREGFRTRLRYAEAVGADFLEIRDYDWLIARRIEPARRRSHAEFARQVRREYRRVFEGLDVAGDPLSTLRRADAVDVRGNFVALFSSLVHSVPVPAPVDMSMLAWSQALYADLYEVHDAPAELRQARQEVLRTTWDDTLDYVGAWHADREFGYRERIVPDAVLASVRPGRNRLGLGLLGGAPVSPWHATGVVDARGIISCDFYLSLHDQGFVPLYSPLLGATQPFAMVPVTATRLAASGTEMELEPDFVSSIGLRRR